jgi:histone acetyltransferase (RNA polymerase elongator complex component)
MTDPAPIAIVTDTTALLGLVRARADLLGLRREDIDLLAELADGHAGKLLSQVPSKGIGLKVVWGLVESVGVKLVAIECPEAMARIQQFIGKRDEKQVRGTNVRSAARIKKKARLERLFSDPRYFNKLARKGGIACAKSLTPNQRSMSASHAANARWKRVREQRRRTRNAPATDGACVATTIEARPNDA